MKIKKEKRSSSTSKKKSSRSKTKHNKVFDLDKHKESLGYIKLSKLLKLIKIPNNVAEEEDGEVNKVIEQLELRDTLIEKLTQHSEQLYDLNSSLSKKVKSLDSKVSKLLIIFKLC